MNFKITLSDTEIVSLVNFIEYWNDVQQADQDLLDNIARKLDQTIITVSYTRLTLPTNLRV